MRLVITLELPDARGLADSSAATAAALAMLQEARKWEGSLRVTKDKVEAFEED